MPYFLPSLSSIDRLNEDSRSSPHTPSSLSRMLFISSSGTSIQEVNRLLKQFEGTRSMMKSAMDGSLASRLRGLRR